MTSGQGGAPAGWYADPQNPQQQRYFDGAQWTEHVQAEPAAAPAAPTTQWTDTFETAQSAGQPAFGAAETGYSTADPGYGGVDPGYGEIDPGFTTTAAPRRSRMVPALLVVLALAAGFAAGYYVGNSDDSDATVTTTTRPSRTSSPASPTPVQSPTPAGVTMNDIKTFLKDATAAQETHFSDFSTYATTVAQLQEAGLRVPAGISFRVIRATKSEYCMTAQSPSVPGQVWFISTPPGGGSTTTSSAVPESPSPTLRPCT